jgi:1,4-dihydroxy-2-naphthoate octaprenyltransferase
VPGLAFVLQAREFHRIMPAFTFPLTLLALAFVLASNFQSFASDQKYGRNSLSIRLTWQRSVPLHHISILMAYLLFGAAPLLGFPWAVTWPVLTTIPLGLMQIFWLNRITIGGKPIWPFFHVLSASAFGSAIYMLAITFWMR